MVQEVRRHFRILRWRCAVYSNERPGLLRICPCSQLPKFYGSWYGNGHGEESPPPEKWYCPCKRHAMAKLTTGNCSWFYSGEAKADAGGAKNRGRYLPRHRWKARRQWPGGERLPPLPEARHGLRGARGVRHRLQLPEGTRKRPRRYCQKSTSMLQPLMKPLYWMNMLLGAYVAIAFTKETAKMIQLRRNNPEYRKPGILQNLLDAEYREDCNAVNNDPVDISKTSAGASKSRMLTTDEVLLSASSLFIAGYDTTSTSLSYITYLLAKHQDVQSKVRKEVNNAVFSNANFEYEAVTRKLPYLSQVVNEALRLYPPVLVFITRTAVSDFEYNGVKYKAGTCVMSPTLQIHRDARYWPDPLTFDPDRFSPDNEGTFHKVAHQPFGVGPRNCVGMRMAQVTLNFTIARLLQRFHLELGPSQGEGSLDIGSRSIVSEPSNGPWIVFRRLSTPHHERVKQAVDS
ncbi:thromboxane-A synthase-like isoform X3 [Amblyomma americanum]